MPLIITDLDGTLSKNEHRQHWLDPLQHPELTDDERWFRFFLYCGEDEPNNPVIKTLNAFRGNYGSEYKFAVFSGRSEKVIKLTEMWLAYYEVPYDYLVMRKEDDRRPDHIVKKELFEAFLEETGYTLDSVLFVLDDRQSVVDMWRSLGLTCFQVAPGNF